MCGKSVCEPVSSSGSISIMFLRIIQDNLELSETLEISCDFILSNAFQYNPFCAKLKRVQEESVKVELSLFDKSSLK